MASHTVETVDPLSARRWRTPGSGWQHFTHSRPLATLRHSAYLALLLTTLAAPSLAQAPSPDFASAFLPAGHWAQAAVRRVVGLGLVRTGIAWPDGSLTRRAAALALSQAATDVDRLRPEVAPAVRGYWERFRDEFPATAAAICDPSVLSRAPTCGGRPAPRDDKRRHQRIGEGWVASGMIVGRGEMGTGLSDWRQNGGTGPIPLDNRHDATAELVWAATPSRYVALSVAPRYADDWRSSEGFVYAAYKRAGLWGGRRALGYGPAVGGGIIANATSPVDGGGLVIDRLRLPWLLQYLGELGFEGTLSRIDSNNAIKHPWLMLLHASIVPHPRLELGANWGAVFSGSGRPPLTWRNFFTMIKEQRAIFVAGEEFENQLASIEVRYRPPLRFPLVVYTEWGSEDNHSAWWDVPGIVAGAELMAVPRAPNLSLGVERTYFGDPCFTCGSAGSGGFGSNWYRHWIYQAGWAVDPVPLGHPLGGNGREWLVHARLDLRDARLRLAGRAFRRDRGYYNLFAPDREGRSYGVGLKADYRARPGLDVSLDAMLEVGQKDWREGRVGAAARLFLK